MEIKYGIRAVFIHAEEGDFRFTNYPEKLFDSKEEAEEAICGEYGDMLAQAATIDSENEEDLKGYSYVDLDSYEVIV